MQNSAVAESSAILSTELAETEAGWSSVKRIGFRALFIYFVLYALPFPFTVLPVVGGFVFQAVDHFWKSLAPWVGTNVLGLEGEMIVGFTGSGDTTLEYVKLLIFVVATIVGTVVWTLLDPKARAYPLFAKWLTVACRYYLGLIMLSYGISKVIPVQFQRPPLMWLLQTYGESSPMRLAWTFMGSSPAYTIFAGVGEVVGGLLLFFERTRAIGALVLIGVVTNVVMINFSYDVPVKLYSSHLLLISVALLLLDWRRLQAFFLLNRSAPPAARPALFSTRRANLAAKTVGLLILASAVFANVTRSIDRYRVANPRERHELYGIYDVETFTLDGEEQPPLLSDEVRWRGLVIENPLPTPFAGGSRPGSIFVRHMNERFQGHPVVVDSQAETISILPRSAAFQTDDTSTLAPIDVLTYDIRSDVMVLTGTWKGEDVEITLRRRDPESILLLSRGFHWINERPYNR